MKRLSNYLFWILTLTKIGALAVKADTDNGSDHFLQFPTIDNTKGIIEFHDNRWPVDKFQRFLWSDGQLILENLAAAKSTNGNSEYRVLSAEGTYNGTNWSYQNQTLTIEGELSDDAKSVRTMLQGMTPESFLLSTILGRGFTTKDLKTMNRISSCTYTGFVNATLPIILTVTNKASGELELHFEQQSKSGAIIHQTVVKLAEFQDELYIPRFVKKYRTKEGVKTVLLDVGITSYTNSISDQKLSPWERYISIENRIRGADRIFVIGSSNTIIPIRNQSEIKDPFSSPQSKNIKYILACVMALVTVVFMFIVFRWKNKH